MALIPILGLTACTLGDAGVMRSATSPSYDGIVTRLLDDDLVNFKVAVSGAATPANASQYAECAAAQYTLIRGYFFARHLRTTVDEDAGVLRADAVYTISPNLPRGSRTIDAEVVVADCTQSGIPTV